ncbi:programmed cell death 1 ligand 1 [Pyxicephalus adspersus]
MLLTMKKTRTDHVCVVADSLRLKRIQMDKSWYLLSVLILCRYFTTIFGLLTVEAIKSSYTAEYGGEITMECHFTVTSSTNFDDITVIWKHIIPKGSTSEVAKYSNGKEAEIPQNKDYRDRVKLLSDELFNGRAILKISSVKMTDAGQYLCIIASQGSDFKLVSLEVQAPYEQINTKVTDVVTASGQTVKELTCQSVGYPKAEVKWLSSSGNISAISNNSHVLTAEGLFNVTSVIRILSATNRTFTCVFWNDALQNSPAKNFTFTGMVSNYRQHEWISAVVIIVLIILSIPLLIFIYGHHKGHYKKRITDYKEEHSDEALSLDISVSTTNQNSGHNSKHNVIDVENTYENMIYPLFFLLIMPELCTVIFALFVVTVPKSTYTVKYGDTVNMSCHFPFKKDEDINELKVSWQHHEAHVKTQVVRFTNGKEEPINQENPYRGRASLLTEELIKGEAILQIKDVKLIDAGTYLCMLQFEGSDYHKVTLEVQAPYTNIQMSSHVSEADNQIYLSCYSLGFPKADVYWTANGVNINSPANISHVQTEDGFYNTTSTIKIMDRTKIYSCLFWNKALNETTGASIRYPDLDNYGPSTIMKILIPCLALFIVFVILFTCFQSFRKKGEQSYPV